MVSTKATGISTFFMLLIPATLSGIILVSMLANIYVQGTNYNPTVVGQMGICLGLLVDLIISFQVYLYFESKEPIKKNK